VHWADPLNAGCGMMTVDCSSSQSAAALISGKNQGLPPDVASSVVCGRVVKTSSRGISFGSPSSPCCQQYVGPVPATLHLHGGVIPTDFDGGPDSWFTPDGRKGSGYTTIGSPGAGKAIYRYANIQEPGTLWFHDHTLGVTRLNVAAGLAGGSVNHKGTKSPN